MPSSRANSVSTTSNASASTVFDEPSSSTSRPEALDSTDTLINPPPTIHFVFDKNSVINATIYARSGPRYRVETNRAVTRTELCDLTQQRVVATIKRRDLFPDVVIFAHRNQGKGIRLKKWLQKQQTAVGRRTCAHLVTEEGTYIWTSDETHRLALYENPSGDAAPMAYSRPLLEPPTIGLVLRRSSSTLEVEMITSFLVLEHKLRMKEKQLLGGTLYGPLNGQYVMGH